MKRINCILLIAALLFAASCQKQEKAELERLQQEADRLQQLIGSTVAPEGESVVPQEDAAFAFSFDKTRYAVDAGGSVTVGYSLPVESTVQAECNGAWSVDVNAQGATGRITISAPEAASPCDVVVTATDAAGHRTSATLNVMVRDPYTDAVRPDFMAMGYYGFKPHVATLENFQKLADAGIRAITIETDESDYMRQMDFAAQVGMKAVPVVWYYAERYAQYGDEYTGLDEVINLLKDHPATMAYHIYDEPSTALIPYLKKQKDKIESLDPVHPVYINLNPDGSPSALGVDYYHDYIEAFARDCEMKFISFDMYPMRPETDPQYPDGIVGYWYQCMEAVSSITKKYGIPFWAFAASCWIDKEQNLFAKPSVENLRLQVYTDLAYGAQVVEYFTIMQYGGTDFAPIMADGTWSGAYDILKEFNLEMQKRGYIFNGCKMDRVRYTGVPPFFCQALSEADLPPQIGALSTAGNALVSFLENAGNQYVAVCSRSHRDKNTLDLVLNDMVYVIDRDGQFIECPAGPATFAMDEGDMLVIKVK